MIELHPDFKSRFAGYRVGLPTAQAESNARYRPSSLERLHGWLNEGDGIAHVCFVGIVGLVLLFVATFH